MSAREKVGPILSEELSDLKRSLEFLFCYSIVFCYVIIVTKISEDENSLNL